MGLAVRTNGSDASRSARILRAVRGHPCPPSAAPSRLDRFAQDFLFIPSRRLMQLAQLAKHQTKASKRFRKYRIETPDKMSTPYLEPARLFELNLRRVHAYEILSS